MKPYNTNEKVIQYFENQEILYNDWYESYYSSEAFPGQPVAIMPNIDYIMQSFNHWFIKRKNVLYNLICVEWDYPNRKKEYSDSVTLAVALSDFIISSTIKVPSPIALAVLLVQNGLDKLCYECPKIDIGKS
ncbi:MAG: hypothetical protein WA130_19185 [Candidatus Methanoperedens sp.]